MACCAIILALARLSGGAPSLTPLERATANPARVRSEIMLLSFAATQARILIENSSQKGISAMTNLILDSARAIKKLQFLEILSSLADSKTAPVARHRAIACL